MVFFVVGLESLKDRNRMRNISPFHYDFLESSVQCTILLDDLPELLHRGRSDALDLASGKGRLEHVCSIETARCTASSDNGVELIDEQNHVWICSCFVDDRLESFLEITTVSCACYDRA